MEVANVASARRTDEISAEGLPIYVWLPAPSPEPWFTVQHRTYRVCFDCGREFNLPDAPYTHAIQRCSGRPLADEFSPCSYLVILNYLLSVSMGPRS
jgi:hypothetical protein